MSIVTANQEKSILYLIPEGRIDSANAPEVETEMMKACEEIPHESVILNAEKLTYISSAGLRVILKLRKEQKNVEIINTSSEVYEILEMTGFTEIIPVKKAYRTLSVEGCEVIGEGANGKVYRLDPDTIIKVYLNPDSLPDIHRERELARRAFVLGIPTAIPYDVVKVGDGYGSVFELLNAEPFAKLINRDVEHLDHYVSLYVELMKKIHSTEVKPDEMPNMKEVAVGWVDFLKGHLPEDVWNKLYQMVQDVPENYHMMHGDYHIKNVMMQNGEVLLIDMDTLCYGNPIFELASVFNAYVGFGELGMGDCDRFLGIPNGASEQIWDKTLRLYLGTTDEERIKEVNEKAMLVGYVRMMRRVIHRNIDQTETGKKAVEYYRTRITELVNKWDTLVF